MCYFCALILLWDCGSHFTLVYFLFVLQWPPWNVGSRMFHWTSSSPPPSSWRRTLPGRRSSADQHGKLLDTYATKNSENLDSIKKKLGTRNRWLWVEVKNSMIYVILILGHHQGVKHPKHEDHTPPKTQGNETKRHGSTWMYYWTRPFANLPRPQYEHTSPTGLFTRGHVPIELCVQ